MSGKIKNAFSAIHADENLKAETYRNIVTAKGGSRKKSFALKAAPVLAVFAMVFFGASYMTPTSYISIDINPSIEIGVNAFDRVVEVTAENDDAKAIVEAVNLKNMNYVDAMETLEDVESFAKYRDSYTEITVIANDEAEKSKMLDKISRCSLGKDNAQCFAAGDELRAAAQAENLSFGKYRAYLELLEQGADVTVDEIRALPMSEIRAMIDGERLSENSQGKGKRQGKGQEENPEQKGDRGMGNRYRKL